MSTDTNRPGPVPNREADERLGARLRQWQGIEPSPGFDRAVWDRIRAEAAAEPVRLTVIELLRRPLAGPAWSAAAAAVLGVGIGVAAAFLHPRSTESAAQTVRLLQPDTLAGAYLAMTTGEGHTP